MNLSIYEKDVYDYIISHPKKLKYKEGLFVEYVINPNCLCLEAKMLMIKNSGLFFQPIEYFEQTNKIIDKKYNPNYTFESYLDYIKENVILIRNVSYMALPIIKLLGVETFDIDEYIRLCLLIRQELEKYEEPYDDMIKNDSEHIKDIVDNYVIAGLVIKNKRIKDLYTINMTEYHAKKMLLFYNDIYDKENVNKVRKLVKVVCDE